MFIALYIHVNHANYFDILLPLRVLYAHDVNYKLMFASKNPNHVQLSAVIYVYNVSTILRPPGCIQ